MDSEQKLNQVEEKQSLPEIDLRRFSREMELFAENCFKNPVSGDADTWRATGTTAAGSTNGFWVKNRDGLLGLAKPGVCGLVDAHLYPAREKIASDLGYMLGFPIPPVLLKKFYIPSHRIGWGAISVSPFSNAVTLRQIQSPWEDDLSILAPDEKDYFNMVASAAYVFDVIMDNVDHNPGNVLLNDRRDGDAQEFGIAMIDYSWIGQSWDVHSVPMNVTKPFYGTIKNQAQCLAFASRFQSLHPDRISEIITRLPDEVLNSAHKACIRQNLLLRQGSIVELIKTAFVDDSHD